MLQILCGTQRALAGSGVDYGFELNLVRGCCERSVGYTGIIHIYIYTRICEDIQGYIRQWKRNWNYHIIWGIGFCVTLHSGIPGVERLVENQVEKQMETEMAS